MRTAALIIISIVFLSSCRKENAFDCFKPNGTEITETRREGEFTAVKVYDKIDLLIKHGTEHKIEVKAGKNIISNVSTEVEGGVLEIRNKNKCNFVRGYKKTISVVVTTPQLYQAFNEGVGTLRFSDGFSQDTLVVRAENSGDIYVNGIFKQIRTSSHGNGDIYLNGVCNSLRVFSFGTNYTFARDLKVNNDVFIESLSIGHCYVNAPNSGKLEYNLWRSGNIYYRGEPAQIINYSDGNAKGKLIKEN